MFKFEPKEFMKECLDVELIEYTAQFYINEVKKRNLITNGFYRERIDIYTEIDVETGEINKEEMAGVFRYQIIDNAEIVVDEIENFAQKVAKELEKETNLPGNFSFEYSNDGNYSLYYQESV